MSPSGYSGFTPSRTRINSFDPIAEITDFNPLCPPALPRSRIRSMPHGRAASSLSTIIAAAVDWYRSSSIRTAEPDVGFRFRPRHPNSRAPAQRIQRQKSHVMRRELVFRTRVSEADNKSHFYPARSPASAASEKLLLLLRLLGLRRR